MIPVVIIGYKRADWMARCRRTVLASTGVDVEDSILMIDDSPNQFDMNDVGMAKCLNFGLVCAMCWWRRSPYIVTLNQDVQVQPDAIANLIEFMDAHPRCAIAGPKILDASNPDRITHGGTGKPYPSGEHLQGLVSHGDLNESKPMTWVNGAANIYRVEAIKAIGLHDERFFLYYQDADWPMRAWKANWECWYCATAVVLDEPNGCSGAPSEKQRLILERDKLAFEMKWNGDSP